MADENIDMKDDGDIIILDDNKLESTFIDASEYKVKDGENDGQKAEKCFVIMPYGRKGEYHGGELESKFIFDKIICPAVKDFASKMKRNIVAYRESENSCTGSITKSILNGIAEAKICIVDITGLNPNVFFELGVRYSLRNKTTILIKQENQDNLSETIPFDIQGFRFLKYNCFEPEQSSKNLCSFLVSSQEEYPKVDSLVFETFKNMEVSIPKVLESAGEVASNNLSWTEWWGRINELKDELKKLNQYCKQQHCEIRVVLGITNGGLIVADLLGRLLFKELPILSLWADRHPKSHFSKEVDRSCDFFDNALNQALMRSIKEMFFTNLNTNEKIGILLVDDLIYTSNTSLQAQSFIKKELKDYEDNYKIIFAPLYCRNSSELSIKQLEEILMCSYMDGCDKNDYITKLKSSKMKFPYEKDLS